MLIGNREIEEKVISRLVENIKKKKELEYVADGFVGERLKDYLKKEAKVVSFLRGRFSEKSSSYKKIIKQVRKELRKVHGLYKIQPDIVKRRECFKELITTKSRKKFLELHWKILETHSSTRERLGFYPGLYRKLFGITGKPKAIMDLGCGINPFSFPFMKLKKLAYYAYDVSFDEINLVEKYFEFLSRVRKSFSGEAEILDLLKLKKADVCFLWKMTDVLDRGKGHKVSERVIVNVPVKYVVVSFPTFTVKGRPMNKPRRKWIELMCRRRGYSYKIVKEKNEIFYVVEKI